MKGHIHNRIHLPDRKCKQATHTSVHQRILQENDPTLEIFLSPNQELDQGLSHINMYQAQAYLSTQACRLAHLPTGHAIFSRQKRLNSHECHVLVGGLTLTLPPQ